MEVIGFVEHSRRYLSNNQPTQVAFAERGLSLRLQDSTVVPIVAQEGEGSVQDGAFPITNVNIAPTLRDRESHPITGVK